MIVSKEPNRSLGGYYHRERWSCTRQKEKEKRQFFYAGHDDERTHKEQIFWSLYPKKFDYSFGGYSHRERWRAPDADESINFKIPRGELLHIH
jgi:hypothetical protein